MKRRRFLSGVAASGLALSLPACSLTDDTPTYRYRLKVEVETPEGLKTGSSVIEVEQSMGRSAGTGFGEIIMRRVHGEAVAVDLPGGRTLFALRRSEDETDWAGNVMQYLAPKIAGEKFSEQFDNVLLIKGEHELPRYWPPFAGGLVLSGYPMLVTFGDLADPTSVALVDPDDLAASFGDGYALKRITVQMTNDPVTTGIEKRLGWLNRFRKSYFDGSSTVSEDMTTDRLTAHLTSGSFSTELAR
ncbi:hypothetical protein EB810_09980 [Altererythrobacter sp. FM1]|uniref:hypothetical protein n=1 Tax=Tsuneonella flava TaxID=2055955 RepID=UPI000C80157B|nr:hypothetical protein [Tsuneonella flava]ROT95405.1 hypothetical protein EB810_09980 [Altererythrobacter sp. FM1]